jgi:hypothetical protein
MFVEEADELLAVCWLDRVQRVVDDYVLHDVAGLPHEFRVQPDVPGAMVAAARSGFPALEKHPLVLNAWLRLRLGDQGCHNVLQEHLVPLGEHLSPRLLLRNPDAQNSVCATRQPLPAGLSRLVSS